MKVQQGADKVNMLLIDPWCYGAAYRTQTPYRRKERQMGDAEGAP